MTPAELHQNAVDALSLAEKLQTRLLRLTVDQSWEKEYSGFRLDRGFRSREVETKTADASAETLTPA
jgi:hypothetical protein